MGHEGQKLELTRHSSYDLRKMSAHRDCGFALEVGHQATRRHLLEFIVDALRLAGVLQPAPHQVLDPHLL